ncbi:MAG: CBS domain-containing protein [Saprospiraceae bacterium]|nr:CBS domain-containing protein [Bacteroidia bacterium]NNK90273.1 CBS domain-containing protein [Saprospiraceae bacterium]
MNIILDKHIKTIMTSNLMTVGPEVIMTEISEIFNSYSFHHIPVVDKDDKPIGIISQNDFHRLQHHFTQLGLEEAEDQNRKFFASLLARDIMITNLICLNTEDLISDAVDIFLQNKVHSILICHEEKCVGIVTPYDILKSLVEPALMSKQ